MKIRKIVKKITIAMVGFVLFGLGTSVWAIPITFDLIGAEDPTNNKVQVKFSYTPAIANIDILITNTSPSYDPRLTAFAFNVPDNVTGISSSTGPKKWKSAFILNEVDTPGLYGNFDVALLTGKNFKGGKPKYGIPIDSTFNFNLVLEGTDLDTLNEMSFLSLYSYENPLPEEAEQYFIARYQRTGSNGEGSDVAIPAGGPAVPEPASLLLVASVLGIVGASYGKKRCRKT